MRGLGLQKLGSVSRTDKRKGGWMPEVTKTSLDDEKRGERQIAVG